MCTSEFTPIAAGTPSRIPKNVSALTSQVVPKSRLKVTRLRVSAKKEGGAKNEEVRAEPAEWRARHARRTSEGSGTVTPGL
jgi:hypothetical protein